ncbi:MAG: hypothetical protein ACI8Z7_000317 [Candidatus Nanohaloarchaea archaeon]|jgi:uncharacterized protein (DUF58 family)
MTTRTLEKEEVFEEACINANRLINELKLLLVYRDIVTGEGLEFDRLREYVPGDSAKMIDWNSLARTQDLYTKVFKEERLLDVELIFDTSDSMATGSTELLKNEQASLVATTLARTAVKAEDSVGLTTFSETSKPRIDSSNSEHAPMRIAEILTEDIYGGKTDWSSVSEDLMKNKSQDSFVFIVSDFIPHNDELKAFIKETAKYFRGSIFFMVRDPLDSKLPEGVGRAYITDPATGEKTLVDVDKIRDSYNKKAREREEELRNIAEASGGMFFKTYTDQDFTTEFARFLDRRVK